MNFFLNSNDVPFYSKKLKKLLELTKKKNNIKTFTMSLRNSSLNETKLNKTIKTEENKINNNDTNKINDTSDKRISKANPNSQTNFNILGNNNSNNLGNNNNTTTQNKFAKSEENKDTNKTIKNNSSSNINNNPVKGNAPVQVQNKYFTQNNNKKLGELNTSKLESFYGKPNIQIWENDDDMIQKQLRFVKNNSMLKETRMVEKDEYDIEYDIGKVKKVKAKKFLQNNVNIFQNLQNN